MSEYTTEIPEEHKRCSKCGEVLPITDFHKNPNMAKGRLHQCKKCVSEACRIHREKNRERINAQKREHYQANRERIRAEQTAKRRANPEYYRERGRKWRAANREHVLEGKRNDYQKHKEKRLATAKLWAERNTEKVKKVAREWKRNNPDKVRAYKHRRRAQKRATSGSFTKTDLQNLFKQQKGDCWWCGCKLESNYHVDHRVPLAKGGTNELGNIVLSCPECNLSKNAKLPGEWNGRLL